MVFKVFCDISVSHIKSEDLYENKDICYEFVPKFDDDKENWDPNLSKKCNLISTQSLVSITSKENVVLAKEREEKIKLTNEEEKSIIEDTVVEGNAKGKEVKKESSELRSEEKINNDEEEDVKEKDSKSEIENVKEILETKNVKSHSFENDTVVLKENKNTENSIASIKKNEYLRKRQRIPLEDITFLFVSEESSISPKRVRIVKDIKEKFIERVDSTKEFTKSVSVKENKKSMKKYNVLSENPKENNLQKHITPLRNISNRANININNNNIKNSNHNKSVNIPKPCIINIKKNKPIKRNYLIPKKTLKTNPNSFNLSARILL